MRAFSRIAFIFNLGFLAAFILQVTDVALPEGGVANAGSANPVVALILGLYFLSGLVNFVFFMFVLYLFLFRKTHSIPRWLLFINFLILLWQFIYFLII